MNLLLLLLLISCYYFLIFSKERGFKHQLKKSGEKYYFMSVYFNNLRSKRRGMMCYTCGYEIIDPNTLYTHANWKNLDSSENIQECCACKRDNSLDFILNKKTNLSKFNKLVLSKKFEKILYGILGLDIIVILVFLVLLLVFKVKINLQFSNYILIVYWLLNIYKTFIVYKNKQKVLQSV